MHMFFFALLADLKAGYSYTTYSSSFKKSPSLKREKITRVQDCFSSSRPSIGRTHGPKGLYKTAKQQR